jgi:hypothetical protein
MTMIDLLAFAVVAIALGTPGLVHLLWGQIDVEQSNGTGAA